MLRIPCALLVSIAAVSPALAAPATLDLDPVPNGKGAGCIQSLLGIHAIVDHVGNHMGMTHRLIGAAHDTERHDGAALLDKHCGDDGVERT